MFGKCLKRVEGTVEVFALPRPWDNRDEAKKSRQVRLRNNFAYTENANADGHRFIVTDGPMGRDRRYLTDARMNSAIRIKRKRQKT